MKAKEIKTLFSLDKKDFEKQVKGLDKLVNTFKSDFNKTNKEVNQLNTELKEMNKELSSLDNTNSDLQKMSDNIKDTTKRIDSATKEMRSFKSEIIKSQKALKDVGDIDLTDVNKLADVMKSIKNIDIIKENDLKEALKTAQKITAELKSVDNISISTRADSINGDINSGMRHWVDNNGNTAASSDSNDSQAILRQILAKLSDNADKTGNEDLIKSMDKVKIAVEQFEKSFRDSMKKASTGAKSVGTNQHPLDDVIPNKDYYGEDEATRLAALLKQIRKRQQDIHDVVNMTNEERKEATRLLDRQEAELEAIQNQHRENNNEVEDTNEELNEQSSIFKKIGKLLGDVFGNTKAGNMFNGVKDGAQSAGNSLVGFADDAAAAGTASTTAGAGAGVLTAGVAAAAIAIAAIVVAIIAYVAILKKLIGVMKDATTISSEFESAVASFAAQVGASQDQVESFSKALKDTFRDQGYTDDIAEMADTLRLVYQVLGLSGDAAEDMAKKISMIAKITNYDVKEIVRAQQRMVTNLNLSAEEALDMILKTYQETGDLNSDLLDTYSEYSSQFAKIGMSAEYFYQILKTGAESGVMNLDKTADAFKELYLRMSDGTDDVKKSLNVLGLSHDVLISDISKGGKDAENAYAKIVTSISEIQDSASKQNVIAALFGAPGEDAGNKFFDMLAEAQTDMEGFKNTTQEAADIIENTLAYQVSEFKNKLTELYDVIGENIVPLVKKAIMDFENGMEDIRRAVDEVLAPAFFQLAAAIAWALGIEDPTNFANAIIVIIELVAGLIEWFARTIVAIRKVAAIFDWFAQGVKMVFLLFEAGLAAIVAGFIGMATAAVNIIIQLALGIGYVVEGIVRSFDDAFMLIVKGVTNMGIGMINGITWAAKKVANAFIDYAINPIISAYNATVAKIPGVGKIDKAGTFNTSSNTLDYMSMASEFEGLGDAWGKDNESLTAMKQVQDEFNKAYSDIWEFTKLYEESVFDDIEESALKVLADEAIITGDFDAYFNKLKGKIDDLVAKGKITVAESEQKKKELQDLFNNTEDKYDGVNELGDKAGSGTDSKALDATQEYYKKLFAWQKKTQDTMINIETIIAEQKWKTQDDTYELIEEQIKFYESIKDRYELTADEMLAYTEKQYDLAISLRKKALDEHKAILQKEENDLKDSNNAKIKLYQSYIDNINDQLTALEEKWSDEDLDKEINRTEKDLAKYQFATSKEGIEKRIELERELEDLNEQKKREAQRRELEHTKAGYEDQIGELEDANETITSEYEDLYSELENLVNDKEAFIAKVREEITNETNENIKKELEDLVSEYENAYNEIEKYTVSMGDYSDWKQDDAQNNIDDSAFTGEDTSEDKWDQDYWKDSNQVKNPDYQRIQELGQQWMAINGGSRATSEEGIAEQDRLHAEANAIRDKWNVTYPTNPPEFIPKFHDGGQVKGSKGKEVLAKLLPGEFVLSHEMISGLFDFFKSFNVNSGLNPAVAGAASYSTVINNSGPLVNIQNFNNNSGADVKQLSQELNSMTSLKNQRSGKRNL